MHQTLEYRRSHALGDQIQLSQAKVLDSREIREAMERRASKKAKKHPKRAAVCHAASVTATEDLEEASIEQQHSLYASSES